MKESTTPLRDFNDNLRNRLNAMSLRKMATKLDISPAFLSAMELGIKPIPEDYIEKMALLFELSEGETKDLARAVYQTNGYVIINKNDPIFEEILSYKVETV